MRAADLALIIGPPSDATLLSRTLAFGVPIVATNDLVGTELVAPRISGATYDIANPGEFKKILKGLLTDPEFRSALSAQARATFAGLPCYEEVKLACAAEIAAVLDARGTPDE